MTRMRLFWVMAMISLSLIIHSQETIKVRSGIKADIDSNYDKYRKTALQIWNFAELGYKEYKSSELLQSMLSQEDFNVQAGVAGIPTAFVAAYGSGKPVIAILGEFDALPGLAQTSNPVKEEINGKEAGHACGHHLFGVGSAAAAIEIKNLIKSGMLKGTIKYFGTPAEEGGAGKVYMVREGLFDGVDVVIHWHPGSANSANPSSSLANMSAKFRFRGQSAHASGAPHRGRSALDGVEAMNHMVNMMREHTTPETRIHYVITDGGKAPNVIPDFAEVYYYVRHPDIDELKRLFGRITKAADGAALGTETRVEYEIIGGVYNLLPVRSLAEIVHANMSEVGGVTYSEEEIKYAEKIQATFEGEKTPDIATSMKVQPFIEDRRGGGGSTDVGDISWVVPTVGMRTATWVPGTAGHSWQAVACGGTDIGIKGMMVAAKTMALTAYDLFTKPDLIQTATKEWHKARGGNFKYEALIGNRPPALDYRD